MEKLHANGDGAGTPYLSLVVPAYNKEEQLPRLLDSVLEGRGGGGVEVLVVDDCSKDGTAKVAAEYALRHPQVRLVSLPRNSGVHQARNEGMRLACGRWVGFIDGDDYLVPGGLDLVLETLHAREGRFEMVFFPLRTSDSGERTGFSKEGVIGIDSLLSEAVFRKEKNCLGFVRGSLLAESGATWYYMHLDHLFWRELTLKAKEQRLLFVDQVAGVYDKGTQGSLGKLRRKPDYFLRHANPKVEAIASFLDRLRRFLAPYPHYSERLFFAMLKDFKYAKGKSGYVRDHLKLMAKYRMRISCYLRYLAALALPAGAAAFFLRLRVPGSRPRPAGGPEPRRRLGT